MSVSAVCVRARHRMWLGIVVWALFAPGLFFGNPGAASAGAKPVSSWGSSDETSGKQVDHGAWQDILTSYLRIHSAGINRFDYAALKGNAEDTSKLAGYLDYLQGLDPGTYSRAEQKAYWINLYNALTVKLVADAYPVDSIRDICRDRASDSECSGPWDEIRARVAGQNLTLDNISNDILRSVWKDSLVHYGLNCASYGCPDLCGTAFTAANTGRLLVAGARKYVNQGRGVNFIRDDLIVISSIYDWYAKDFGSDRRGVIRHLARYADEELAKRLRSFSGTVDYRYDWKLNRP